MEDAATFLTNISAEDFVIPTTEKRDDEPQENGKDEERDEEIMEVEDVNEERKDPTYEPPLKRQKIEPIAQLFKKAQKSVTVTAVADRTKMTDSTVTQFVAAMASSLNLDVEKTVYGRSTVRTTRIENREKLDQKISKKFLDDIKLRNVKLTLHWDGKIMSNTTNDGTESTLLDRLSIVVTGDGVNKILAIPKLPSGNKLLSKDLDLV